MAGRFYTKKRAQSSRHSAKLTQLASFLVEGPLPLKDLCDIILEYGTEFEGRRLREIKFRWLIDAWVELYDGMIALGCSDSMVRVLDFENGECVQTLAGHTSDVFSLAVLLDGKLASGSGDNTVRIWKDNACLLTLAGHTSDVLALAVLPNGKLVSGSGDMTVRVWEDDTCLLTLAGHTSDVFVLAVLPDGRVASGALDHTVRVWDAVSGACLFTLTGHTSYVFSLAVLPDGKLASGSADTTVRVWEDGACLLKLAGHTGYANALAVLPDGTLASGSDDETVRTWDPTSGECLMTLGADSKVFALLVLSDGNLATTSVNSISIYE